jgi:hypothetical protein
MIAGFERALANAPSLSHKEKKAGHSTIDIDPLHYYQQSIKQHFY